MQDKRKYQRRDREYWRSHVVSWEVSGMSQTEYCRRNNISFSSFANWETKLMGTQTGKQSEEPVFVEIEHGLMPMREVHIRAGQSLFRGEGTPEF
ncbi:MAG: hypothetical protein CVV44_05535 [Spirochaetae bacterium HGW-Spirochaetae-1]|nr:MAG: hypothetical protein CVV44_05535 [Spirochaetae bacterium HGW-Spirochaetae-1]